MNTSLTIKVNDHCTLDAGCWQECLNEEQKPFRLIFPPLTTMYHQLLSYLETATTDWKIPPKSQLHFGEVALATVAVCIRWGSYFTVLVNDDTPQWALADHGAVSCLDDSEMARINIEASAALAEWMSLIHSDPSRFRVLTKAAVQLLPSSVSPPHGSTSSHHFRALSRINSQQARQSLMQALARDVGSEWVEQEQARVLTNPVRALANGILHRHWRNGSAIETLHAGSLAPARPLTQRRPRDMQRDNLKK